MSCVCLIADEPNGVRFLTVLQPYSFLTVSSCIKNKILSSRQQAGPCNRHTWHCQACFCASYYKYQGIVDKSVFNMIPLAADRKISLRNYT